MMNAHTSVKIFSSRSLIKLVAWYDCWCRYSWTTRRYNANYTFKETLKMSLLYTMRLSHLRNEIFFARLRI